MPELNVRPLGAFTVTVEYCSAASLVNCSVPAVIVVAPLKRFAPPKVSVPVSSSVNAPLPLRPPEM